MNILLEKSLINCHCTGLDSIVIKDKPGMIRMFIARRDHQLYLNDAGNAASLWSVALHRHHCDVTLHPFMGDVYNITISEQVDALRVKMRSYRYESPISSEHGKFTPVENQPIPIPLRTDLLRSPALLRADLLHSVYVPYGKAAAWYIWEGDEDSSYNPIVYTNRDLKDFDFTGLNQPMTLERLTEDLRLINVLPGFGR